MHSAHAHALDYFLIFLSLILISFGIGAVITTRLDKKKTLTGTIKAQALSYTSQQLKGTMGKYKFAPSTLKSKEKELFLDLHNKFREKNNRKPLVWNDYLARSAEAYAEKLLREKCAIYHPKTKDDDERYLQSGAHGQNLSQFVNTGRPIKGLKVGSIEKAVQLWRDECHEYDPEHPTKGNVGHFTAMLWKPTRHVGCAYREMDTERKQASIYVCHYEKSGNWLTSDGGFELFDENVGKDLVCDDKK